MPGSVPSPHTGIAGRLSAARSIARYVVTRAVVALVVRAVVRLRLVRLGTGRLPAPSILCFNHLNWTDPFVLLAALPWWPRVYILGPSEVDMSRGWRNRLIDWTGLGVPVRPGREDMLAVARRVEEVLASGAILAVAGEGRIHHGETALLPLQEGVAFFALRNRVPIVPCAINGTSWIDVGRRVRIRLGEPIPAVGRPTGANVRELTDATWTALHDLSAGYPDQPVPGRFGAWLTELFNEWTIEPEPAAHDAGHTPVGEPPSDVDRQVKASGGKPEPARGG